MIHDGREAYGGYLEDFNVGDVFQHWPGKTVTEMDNHLFSLLTMNHNPLHIVGMSVRDTSGKAIANLEYERITHDGPVFHGDTIYSESEVLEIRESRSRPDRGIVYIESRGLNQRNEQILTLRRRFLVPKRGD